MTNWQTKTIKDITTLIKDGTHGTHKDVENGIPLLSAKDISAGKVNVAPDSRVISEADFNAIHARYSLKDGDILLTIVGSLGRVAIVTNYANNYTFQRSVAILRFNNEVDTSYAYYYLTSSIFQKELLKRESKGAQGGVYLGDISKIKIHIPEKPEQERIVGVLEVWDEYIEKLEQKIALKEQLKKGLMQQLLTGKRRLPGFNDEWHDTRLGDIAKIQSGGTPSSKNDEFYGNDIIWVSIADMTSSGKYISDSQRKLSKLGYESSTARLYPANTVLYAMYASIGECVIASVPLSSSQAILGIQPSDKLDNEFLYYYLISKKNAVKLLGQQGTQSNLNAGIVKDFVVNLPTIQEQRAVSAAISKSDDEINLLKDKLSTVKLQKKYLLRNLITGTIRAPEDLKSLDTSRLERSAL